jgi:hypothetical protein
MKITEISRNLEKDFTKKCGKQEFQRIDGTIKQIFDNNDGMIVNAEPIRELWEALEKFRDSL